VKCVRVLVRLGADVKGLFERAIPNAAVKPIVNNIRAFVAATTLDRSEHQFTLYSITQLAAYYLQRRQYPDHQPENNKDNQPEDD
jgi:hypothetical protein